MLVQEFDEELASLIDAWCGHRQLVLLRTILNVYPRAGELTDDWAELMNALKTIRVQYGSMLEAGELDRVVNLLHFTEKMVYR